MSEVRSLKTEQRKVQQRVRAFRARGFGLGHETFSNFASRTDNNILFCLDAKTPHAARRVAALQLITRDDGSPAPCTISTESLILAQDERWRRA